MQQILKQFPCYQGKSLQRLKRTILWSDSPDIWIVMRSYNHPEAILKVSQPKYPNHVFEEISKAKSATETLPEKRRKHILIPNHSGSYEGLSYAIYPFCQSLTQTPLWGRFFEKKTSSALLEWLHLVVQHTKASPQPLFPRYHSALEAIIHCSDLPDLVRTESKRCEEKLMEHQWTPFHTLAHNDLWSGNVMKLNGNFVIIDWGGSDIEGFPIYDLIRWLQCRRLSKRQAYHQISLHCESLQCNVDDSMGYLLAALGNLYLHRGKFPMENYIPLVDECVYTLRSIIS